MASCWSSSQASGVMPKSCIAWSSDEMRCPRSRLARRAVVAATEPESCVDVISPCPAMPSESTRLMVVQSVPAASVDLLEFEGGGRPPDFGGCCEHGDDVNCLNRGLCDWL